MRVVEEFLMDNQPNHFHKDDTANMLEEALRKGASDIHIEGNKPIVVDVHGKLYPLTSRALVGKEVENIIKKLYDDNALSEIYQLRALDTSYTLRTKDERNKTISIMSNGINVAFKNITNRLNSSLTQCHKSIYT